MTPFGTHEMVLNYTANRFQLLRPHAVGPTSKLIRECDPKSPSEWEDFYWENAYTRTSKPVKVTPELLDELGDRLYAKMKEIVAPEFSSAFDEVTLEECRSYIRDVTLRRTYMGYHRESAVHRVLSVHYDGRVKFLPADSHTDSALDIDFEGFIADSNIRLGIQVKPLSSRALTGSMSVSDRAMANFHKYEKRHGGKVFLVHTKKRDREEVIVNQDELIESIDSYLETLGK